MSSNLLYEYVITFKSDDFRQFVALTSATDLIVPLHTGGHNSVRGDTYHVQDCCFGHEKWLTTKLVSGLSLAHFTLQL